MQNVTHYFASNPGLVFLLILVMLLLTVIIYSHNALGQYQSSSGNKVQTWIDNLSNIKIEFTYSPAIPVIDTPTELKFNVENLQNGTRLDDLLARVIVLTTSSGQERSFKFPNIFAQNGSFSVKYLFPDSGSYQVISRIYSKGFLTLASFNVFIPPQALGTANITSTSLLVFSASLAGIIGIIAFIVITSRKKRKAESNNL